MSTNADGNSPTTEVEPQEQPAPEQEPKPKGAKTEASKPETKTPDEAKPKGRAPWEDDLYGRGLDDPRFHEYMRDVQQPYVTKIEQQIAQYREQFGEDPEAIEVAADIFSRILADPDEHPGVAMEAVRQIVNALEMDVDELFPYEDPEAEYNAQPEAEPGQEQPQELTPEEQWVRDRMTTEQQERETEWYNGVVAKLSDSIPGFNEQLWHTCVLAAQGDLDAAMDQYEKLAPPHDPPKPAPPTHGGGTGAPPPKEAKRYGNISDAIDDFLDEEKAARGR